MKVLQSGLLCLLVLTLSSGRVSCSNKPNIVVFLVDDLGIADLGCFGNATIKTPNIDRLASLGAKLNHNLAPESICTPSRAATLTGRYAIRSGMAAQDGQARVLINIGAPGGLPPNETTIAEVLKDSGYMTSYIGKWHLGLNCHDNQDGCHQPRNMGFDEFYGVPMTNIRGACGHYEDGSTIEKYEREMRWPYIPAVIALAAALGYLNVLSGRRATMLAILITLFLLAEPTIMRMMYSRFICVLMRDYEVVEQPYELDNLTVKFTHEANQFIERNTQQPFFLFMSYLKVHTSLFTSAKFKGHSVHGKYGDNVEEMDWSVGEIVNTLEKHNVFDNTFVYFTSDHGPWLEEILPNGEYHGGWKGHYKGGKGQSWEGGIRVPTVAMWKGHIPPGIVVDEPTNTMDIFPTLAELGGGMVPSDRIIDGKNILALLKQQESLSPHEFMFHYCGTNIHAVRYRPRTGRVTWKAHFITPKWSPGTEECHYLPITCNCGGKFVTSHDPPLLYDVTNDPYERQPLDGASPAHQHVISKIKEAMRQHQAGIKPVPKQLGWPNAFWRPHLQPCCNFPFCSCTEQPK